jgi:hypothetical protein
LLQRQIEPEEELESLEPELYEQLGDDFLLPKRICEAVPQIGWPGLEARVQSLRGSGQPLPQSVRSFFEPRFGRDFGGVRVHVDARATEAARLVDARAFTLGQDIVFRAGQYQPETMAGQRLLAHELTHVVQQARRDIPARSADLVVQRVTGGEIVGHAESIRRNQLLATFYDNGKGGALGTIVSNTKWPGGMHKSELQSAAISMKLPWVRKMFRRNWKSMGLRFALAWYAYSRVRKYDTSTLSKFPIGSRFIFYNRNKCNLFVFDAFWNAGKHYYLSNRHYPAPPHVSGTWGKENGLTRIPNTADNPIKRGDLFVEVDKTGVSDHVGLVRQVRNRWWFQTMEWYGALTPRWLQYPDPRKKREVYRV